MVDPHESILIRTPSSTTLTDVVQELGIGPGLINVDTFPATGEAGFDEEEEDDGAAGNGADVSVGWNSFEPTIAVNPNNSNNVIVAEGARTPDGLPRLFTNRYRSRSRLSMHQ